MFGFLFLPFRIVSKVAYTGALVALPFVVIEAKTGLRPKTYLLGNDFYQQSVCDAYLWGGQFLVSTASAAARGADWFEGASSDNIAGKPPPSLKGVSGEKGKGPGGLW
ncbi:hypothetical protein BDY24DRAFT_375712 [Mrakia frigida]|uniref:uncharacterized protein n=1 Tax=Mrakia frigida TaxID=29902 RepID=UPI003FCBF959